MTTTDQLRTALRDLEAKAKEMELDKKLTTFADQADQYLQRAATMAGELAHDNRERIDEQLARAGDAVDGKTEGRYASYVGKVRTGLMTGVDWVADQRTAATTPSPAGAPSAEAPPTGSVPAQAPPGSAPPVDDRTPGPRPSPSER